MTSQNTHGIKRLRETAHMVLETEQKEEKLKQKNILLNR